MLRLAVGITAATLSLGLVGVATLGPVTPQARTRRWGAVLGYRLGSREASGREIGRYWRAVDRSATG